MIPAKARLANLPPCFIGMEACVGAHHLSRKLQVLGHDARLMPAKYVRPLRQRLGFRYTQREPPQLAQPRPPAAAHRRWDQVPETAGP